MTIGDIDTAALRNLPQSVKRGPTELAFQLGYGSKADLDRQRDAIQECRLKVSQIQDKATRKAYEGWLNYFQAENDRAREEMETGKLHKQWLAYKERQEAEERRIKRCQDSIEKPW